ncbi:MAG: hypothetical protein ACI9X4_002689 [Glaciecola sp.]|jgi:hypothetical protein
MLVMGISARTPWIKKDPRDICMPGGPSPSTSSFCLFALSWLAELRVDFGAGDVVDPVGDQLHSDAGDDFVQHFAVEALGL